MITVAEFINDGVQAAQKGKRFAVPIHARLEILPHVGSYFDAYRLALTSQREQKDTSSCTLISAGEVSRLALESESNVVGYVAGIVKPQILQHQAYWHSRLWC